MGWRPDLQDKIQDAEKPVAGRHGGWEYQYARLAVLSGQDGALPLRAVPPLEEEPAHPTVLVVLVPDSVSGAPLQGVSEWKAQQKILWAEVQKETGKWKSRWEIRDLLVDERCSWAVLDFLASTDVGGGYPPRRTR